MSTSYTFYFSTLNRKFEKQDTYCHNGKQMDDKMDTIKRPSGTGMGYSNINLSKLCIKDKDFKSICFNGTDLSFTVFYNCSLSRCTFINANLTNTKFIYCKFNGEETVFYKATTNKNTRFAGCGVEYIDKWVVEDKSENIISILKNRLLEEPFTVL
jgi:hypothetical protein